MLLFMISDYWVFTANYSYAMKTTMSFIYKSVEVKQDLLFIATALDLTN